MAEQRLTPALKSILESPVVLLGFGREGVSTYQFIRSFFPDKQLVVVADCEFSTLQLETQQLLELDAATQYLHADQFVPSANTLVYTSPGIPPHHHLLQKLQQEGARITSNTELFFELLESLPTPPVTIGVTGTKGKSTTTKLIHHVLSKAGVPAWLGGNIGVPPLDLWGELCQHPQLSREQDTPLALSANAPTVVLELSAHQLLHCSHSPTIAVLLNVTPEHLDYYSSFQEYLNAKARLVSFQSTGDFVVYNPTLAAPATLAEKTPAARLTFAKESQNTPADVHASVSSTHILYCGEPVLETSEVPLNGEHNLLNALPAVLIAKQYGISNQQIRSAIQTFHGLPHRLEQIRKLHNVTFINDSLATTPESAVAALRSFPETPIVLIAGGKNRNLEFSLLGTAVAEHAVRALILFPETGPLIEQAARAAGYTGPVESASSMQQAVQQANAHAQPGDTVLLSPGSASFNLFRDYADRGNQFRTAVNTL